ncbi:hypothetical protein [Phenylobacterium sp.]|uniref:hypothetical protein n=1 Tax=Phenylobacterium sp. TaxID=1871053 RepID=UPI00121E78BD|nr:hypothetical protein [Phenylobacterium sp.]THD64448.1 MAG: hypothetical protein E8A49_02925 [Phenylobacterium sp.]
MQILQPSAVRYIKLGPGGAWLERCLAEGLVELGYENVPHELATAGRWDLAEQSLVAEGRSPGKAKSFIREVRDFYAQGADCLWVTIGQGRLWWAFAEPEVTALDQAGRGSRQRRTIGGWSDKSLTGERLDLARLSTRLTKVAAYQQTICQVGEADYLLRRLNGVEDPLVARGQAAAKELTPQPVA